MRYAASPVYLLKSFSVFRSSTTYAKMCIRDRSPGGTPSLKFITSLQHVLFFAKYRRSYSPPFSCNPRSRA